MTSRIPTLIPQLDDGPASWPYFLYKCCTGSDKVHEMLYLAEWALMGKLVGYPIHEEQGPDDYDEVLSAQFSLSPPFPSREDLMEQLVQAAKMQRLKLSAYNRRDAVFYHSLWKRGVTAQAEELLHDAVLYAWANWSADTYRTLEEEVEDEDPNFNSLHGLVAMILLISTFKDKSREAFKDKYLSLE